MPVDKFLSGRGRVLLALALVIACWGAVVLATC